MEGVGLARSPISKGVLQNSRAFFHSFLKSFAQSVVEDARHANRKRYEAS